MPRTRAEAKQVKEQHVEKKQPKAKPIKKRQRGKHWTAEEEDYFWPFVVKVSPKAVGGDPDNTMSWDDCGKMMEKKFGTQYRTYTGTCLSEHHFQNIQKQRISRYARDHVRKYQALLKREELGLSEERKEEEEKGATKPADPVEEERKEEVEKVNSCLGKRRNVHDDGHLVIDPALHSPEPERPKKRIKIISRARCTPPICVQDSPKA